MKTGQRKPEGYSRGETDFRRLCGQEDLDLVYTATPWEWHVPVCLAAMNNGKHAATEVPAAVTLDECWQLVETAEKTGRHCVMMENCCYDRTELMILNMVRQGLLGELIHAECGYLHDLRGLMLGNSAAGRWRLAHCEKRNGDLSHARNRPRRAVHEHQPRQPVCPPRLDGQPVAGAEPVCGKGVWPRQPASPKTLCPQRRGKHAHPDGRGPNHRRDV